MGDMRSEEEEEGRRRENGRVARDFQDPFVSEFLLLSLLSLLTHSLLFAPEYSFFLVLMSVPPKSTFSAGICFLLYRHEEQ